MAYTVMRRPDLSLVLDRIRNKRRRVGVAGELARIFPGERPSMSSWASELPALSGANREGSHPPGPGRMRFFGLRFQNDNLPVRRRTR